MVKITETVLYGLNCCIVGTNTLKVDELELIVTNQGAVLVDIGSAANKCCTAIG